jgi:hypothetical protein
VVTSGRLNRCFLRICLLSGCLWLCWLATSCSSSSHVINVPVSLQFTSPASTPTIELGQTLSVTVSETVTWSLKSGCGFVKPAGTLTQATGTTVVYNAPTPTSTARLCPNATNFQDVIVATNTANQSAQLLIVVVNPVTITNAASYTYGPNAGPGCAVGVKTCCPSSGTLILPSSNGPTGSNGIAQLGTLATVGPLNAGGGLPPYSWQVTSGASSLPNGLALGTAVDKNTGQLDAVIQGKPISPGCSTFTITVADSTAAANCDPTVQPGPCSQATFNVVVLPQPLKIQVPNYPSAYNDLQNGDQGVPYPLTAIVPSGGQAPYFWCQSPTNGVPNSTLPPGLELNSTTQPNFDCPLALSSNSAVISGRPGAGAENAQNGCNGGTNSGCYYTQFQVYDSQQPYPATINASLANMADLPLMACSQANQAPLVNSVLPDSYLQGPIAFLLHGFDSNGPVVIAGSVTLDGAGNVTGGVEDITRGGASGHQYLTIQNTVAQQSWYVVGTQSATLNAGLNPDYSRGCMTLYLANNGVPAGTTTFAFTLGGCSNHFNVNGVTSTSSQACGATPSSQAAGTYTTGHIIEFDDNTGQGTRASGILRAQDTSSFSGGLSGPYAFGLSGGDAAQKHYAVAGSFNASSGSLKSVAADVDDAGTLASTLTGGTGSYTVDTTYGASNGRWTATMGLKGGPSFDEALYMVSSSEALIATTDPLSASQPIIGGEAITTAASFSGASLQNSHIFRIGGLSASGPDVSIGALSFDGVGAVTGTEYEDQAGTLGTTTISGTYTVDPATGRASFLAGQDQNLGPHPFIAYVIPAPANLSRTSCSTPAACITGFLVGTDATAQDGVLEFQTPSVAPPPPFSNLYVSGNYNYGTAESLDPLTPNLEGDVFAQPSGTSTTSGSLALSTTSNGRGGTQDVSYGDPSQFCVPSSVCYLLMPNQAPLGGSYSISSNGTGSFGGSTIVSVANGNVIFYIDESPTNPHPAVIVAEQ